MQRHRDTVRLGAKHFRRKARIDANRVEIQVWRCLEQHVILARWKAQEVSLGSCDYCLSDAKCRRAADDQIELRLGVKVTRATATEL